MKRRPDRAAPAVVPALVSDQSSMAAIGLDPRQFRRLIAEKRIVHAVVHRHVVAKLSDVIAALGLGDGATETEVWNEDAAVRRVAARGRR